MNEMEAIQTRHSVRQYTGTVLSAAAVRELEKEIQWCSEKGHLHIELVKNAPEAFSGRLARYGRFENVHNYIVIAGTKSRDLEERAGYYGEKIVIKAQQLGLNTCWVGLTYSKGKLNAHLHPGEKVICVIAVGYGKNAGVPHKSKDLKDVILNRDGKDLPKWFLDGVRAALLAPTALNQQKFRFEYLPDGVRLQAGTGFYTHVDKGIAKYHFEKGAGNHVVTWKD